MQRKPGFPAANCNIKMPDSSIISDVAEDDWEPQQRRQQLINFGHSQWTFNNWSWSVTKQDLDFVELVNGKYTAGVAAFVNVTVKSFDIHRENVGYATSVGVTKGSAIHRARKCAVTNALRETLLSFGGTVASELLEQLEARPEAADAAPSPPPPKPEPAPARPPPAIKNALPPVAKAQPMPANLPPAANRPLANAARVPVPAPPPAPHAAPHPAPHPRANQNEASEEEARAERKRRQKQAQEEFRLKQLMKQTDIDSEIDKNSSSFDNILMAIPTQDIVIEDTGNTAEERKRKSPAPDGSAAKRRSGTSLNKLDIVQTK